ncbi:hypothetical protein EJ110_NYTH18148 [Nymphaea thermarum]|nr:hypothetical protein EJ110_NYTH18148 [Nymphaea thermarum]
MGVPFILSCTYRTRLRERFNLPEDPFPDLLTHLLCEPCALCQEYRELRYRGLDPSIGDKMENTVLENKGNSGTVLDVAKEATDYHGKKNRTRTAFATYKSSPSRSLR